VDEDAAPRGDEEHETAPPAEAEAVPAETDEDPIDPRPHLPPDQSFLTLPGTRDLYRARRWR